MKIYAPAKINLFLEVKNRRPDGYHNIESLMQAVSLYDEITIRPSAKLEFNCLGRELTSDEKNLAFKAAILLKNELNIEKGARIVLRKRIPLGAGLGGGSSDSAAVLKGLLKLWKKKIEPQRLLKIAKELGADVPFFLACGTSIVRGIGERVEMLKKLKKTLFLVVYPGVSVPTSWAYSKLRFPLTNAQKITKIKKSVLSGSSHRNWEGGMFNRFESVVLGSYPQISRVKKFLENSGIKAMMSGSGSAVFGILDNAVQGEKIKKQLRKINGRWRVWTVSSV
ncbi:MAG: 4-(cytidine 5'-diphospho)-2-C-methyl-D-erythritol kinase [Endomicrobiales bacterium]|nr:4-(cytidine 5'-diphospho)-2-C-methyl-D-erythritol kinase [Endomicrobiales bacterium]